MKLYLMQSMIIRFWKGQTRWQHIAVNGKMGRTKMDSEVEWLPAGRGMPGRRLWVIEHNVPRRRQIASQ